MSMLGRDKSGILPHGLMAAGTCSTREFPWAVRCAGERPFTRSGVREGGWGLGCLRLEGSRGPVGCESAMR